MNTFLQKYGIGTGALLIVVLAVLIGAWTAHTGKEAVAQALETEVAAQRETLIALAEITDRNGADPVTGAIVTDCARRNEFDALLMTLATLTKQELLSLQNLFESCGDFYPVQKALMVTQLEREYALYTRLEGLQDALGTDTLGQSTVWEELITLEKMRSTLLTEQSSIQQEIITELVSGSGVGGTQVRALVAEAQEIAELLAVYDKRIDELRGTLIAQNTQTS